MLTFHCEESDVCLCEFVSTCIMIVYIHVYIHMYVYMYVYIYVYMYSYELC